MNSGPFDNKMPAAASLVVLVYAIGVVWRGSTVWYEWLGAGGGLLAMSLYWFFEFRRMRRKRDEPQP